MNGGFPIHELSIQFEINKKISKSFNFLKNLFLKVTE
jgi:hypothetical protein